MLYQFQIFFEEWTLTLNKSNLIDQFSHLLEVAGYRSRRYYVYLLAKLNIAAILEIVTLGLFVPYLALLTRDTNEILNFANKYIPIIEFSPTQFKFTISIVFLLLVFLSVVFRVFVIFEVNLVAAEIGNRLQQRKLTEYIYADYEIFQGKDVAEVLSDTTHRINLVVSSQIQLTFLLIANILIIAAALIALSIISLVATIAIASLASALYLLVFRRLNKSIRNDTIIANNMHEQLIKQVNGIYQSWIEIKIYNKESYVMSDVSGNDGAYRHAIKRIANKSILPRYIIEGVALSTLIVFTAFISRNSVPSTADLILLGAYLAILMRVLPLFQTVLQQFSAIQSVLPISDALFGDHHAFRKVGADVRSESSLVVTNGPTGRAARRVELDGVSYQANNGSVLIDNISQLFETGQIYGITGPTGAGKTTLLLMIMGLYRTSEGVIRINGKTLTDATRSEYFRNISYVGQKPILLNGTIQENITFSGSTQHSRENLEEAIEISGLKDDIEAGRLNLDDKINASTSVLSGGQQQRLNLARAIYQNRPVLVLDEFTSALDQATEARIIERLSAIRKDKIIVIISHRDAPLEICDELIRLNYGGIRS
ncbi:MAG: ABC transporter ATP-binding protein [Rhodobacteraceae bacterium]|nr:ABC transporter ATP-binding protein [Paracoccaceae bacterium]